MQSGMHKQFPGACLGLPEMTLAVLSCMHACMSFGAPWCKRAEQFSTA